jgi:hypothetical protein
MSVTVLRAVYRTDASVRALDTAWKILSFFTPVETDIGVFLDA